MKGVFLGPEHMALAQQALYRALRNDFFSFSRKCFGVVSPGSALEINWHLEAICYALERVARGQTNRLIILVPPRHLKSILSSVALPAWMLGHTPTARLICVSYSQELAAKHARDCRAVIMSPWFQEAFPACRIDPSKNSEAEFMTTQRGFRLATSTGGTLTGRGGDVLIIDDPIKPADAMSDRIRLDCQQWYTNTLLSRLDNKVSGAIIVVMQRLHVDDLTGYLLERGGWEVLTLPAIADTVQEIPIGAGVVHLRKPGGILHPDREPLEILQQIKREMGSADFNAQYQQAPVPAEGNLIRWDWFGFYEEPPQMRDGRIIVQSWDTASSAGELADYSVGITALIDTSGTVWIRDVRRGRWSFPELKREVTRAARDYQPNAILIEDHASGTALQQSLKTEGWPVIPIKPKGDKVIRMNAHTATLEAGYVFLPKHANWLGDFRAEVSAFPNGRFDDQVDALSQILTWHQERRQRTHAVREMRW